MTDNKRFDTAAGDKEPMVKALEMMKQLLGKTEKLDLKFQQFCRLVERVDATRTPAKKDVQAICDELLKTLIEVGAMRQEDMHSHPLVIAGMAQATLLLADAIPFGENIAMKDIELFKQLLRMMLDCTVVMAVGMAQMVASAQQEAAAAPKQ